MTAMMAAAVDDGTDPDDPPSRLPPHLIPEIVDRVLAAAILDGQHHDDFDTYLRVAPPHWLWFAPLAVFAAVPALHFDRAVVHGRVVDLDRGRKLGAYANSLTDVSVVCRAAADATIADRADVLEWLKLHSSSWPRTFSPVNDTQEAAVLAGAASALAWWQTTISLLDPPSVATLLKAAVVHGHIKVLLVYPSTPLSVFTDPAVVAAIGDHATATDLDRIAARFPNGVLPRIYRSIIPARAVPAGNVDALDGWAKHFSTIPTTLPPGLPADATVIASSHGRVKVLEWLHQKARHRPVASKKAAERAVVEASAAAHIPVLEWWRTHSGMWPAVVSATSTVAVPIVEAAAARGALDVLKWWHSAAACAKVRVRPSTRGISAAVEFGHWDVVRFWVTDAAPEWSVGLDEAALARAARVPGGDRWVAMVRRWWAEAGFPSARAAA
ncbi:hypothetical protein BC828DRAFT_86934 [Blastocladiella britannica]|nr:hypothetical protein BC828DRAFT_86934 [Blastocladiella britannica]